MTNWLGNSSLSAFGKTAFSFTVPVLGSISLSAVRSEPEASRRRCSRSIGLDGRMLTGLELGEHRGQGVLGNGEDDGDRLELGDHDETVGVARPDDVAGIDEPQSRPAR